jgi:CubicO group peptidase (beta-lactamase class C family)
MRGDGSSRWQSCALPGYGVANAEHGVRVTPQTVFQSGSIGKQFTAMAIMMLIEEQN